MDEPAIGPASRAGQRWSADRLMRARTAPCSGRSSPTPTARRLPSKRSFVSLLTEVLCGSRVTRRIAALLFLISLSSPALANKLGPIGTAVKALSGWGLNCPRLDHMAGGDWNGPLRFTFLQVATTRVLVIAGTFSRGDSDRLSTFLSSAGPVTEVWLDSGGRGRRRRPESRPGDQRQEIGDSASPPAMPASRVVRWRSLAESFATSTTARFMASIPFTMTLNSMRLPNSKRSMRRRTACTSGNRATRSLLETSSATVRKWEFLETFSRTSCSDNARLSSYPTQRLSRCENQWLSRWMAKRQIIISENCMTTAFSA